MSDEIWEKVLWKPQSYPDNYIPEKYFLASLRKNPNFRPYTYWPLVLASCAITQHLASIYTFLGVFVFVKEQSLDPRLLVWITVGCFLGGYISWEWLEYRGDKNNLANRILTGAQTLKSSILVFLALLALSPVLKTLSAATSSDSIWALSAFLFVLNALLADYSPGTTTGQPRDRLTSVLSMNAAMSSSVVLASRLSEDLAVFALMLFSVQVFALFPMLRQRLQVRLNTAIILQVLMTLFLSCICLCLAGQKSTSAYTLSAATLFFVTFIAPAILVWAQRYKNEIRGPWDVAVPKIN
ncbi:phosphatidylinositol N-acetylglucosaminyltransferase [Athelia psychrophila]|uniref:Phosphatidylinositol N-acetylglucosaminyltransferase n=1 Tax=Athelia psychrophila TaxID=1759441 RepID=A0A166U598_9AGAM|nr:phosphatidylinositol N-acetylglucosaminyltransferase [Fibularhizoctonia sp. CBS 109695]